MPAIRLFHGRRPAAAEFFGLGEPPSFLIFGRVALDIGPMFIFETA
jgi:hypothetical protein